MTTSYSKSVLTLSIQPTHQPDPRNPTSQPERIRKDSDRIRKKRIIEISSQSLLNFDNFIHTDMSLFSAKVIVVEKHVFSPEVSVSPRTKLSFYLRLMLLKYESHISRHLKFSRSAKSSAHFTELYCSHIILFANFPS